jgi:hypothetical protein
MHASRERARIRAWSRAEGACTDHANERSRLFLIRQKDRRRAIGFLRRRAVCDTDDDERRDDDEMGTFFDARTRIEKLADLLVCKILFADLQIGES